MIDHCPLVVPAFHTRIACNAGYILQTFPNSKSLTWRPSIDLGGRQPVGPQGVMKVTIWGYNDKPPGRGPIHSPIMNGTHVFRIGSDSKNSDVLEDS